MKRRIFLATTSTIGIVGAVSGASLVSSGYTSINNSLLLKEFSSPMKKALDKFMADATLNVEALGLDKKYAAHVAMPVQIISKNTSRGNQNITYKNKNGQYISLSVTKGVGRVNVLKTL